MYKIAFAKQAAEDYDYWATSENKRIFKKINELLHDMANNPYAGIGKPEQLKYNLSGKWSRRINAEHRIVYSVNNEVIEIHVFSMKYHYSKK